MPENIVVSERGQITLPSAIRKRLGIEPGGVLVIEESNGALVLRPAAVVALETYSDADIARWDAEDRLSAAQRASITKRLKRKA
jgi:AbrB family looped-hinge helix DNA binding protein